MSGFKTLDDIVYANSVNNRGQSWMFSKAAPAANYTAGKPYSLWPGAGSPGAGAFPGTDKTATQISSSTDGGMKFATPGTSRLNFMTAFKAYLSGGIEGELHLVDKLLSYDQLDCNITTDQTMTNGVGLTRYTDGIGNRIIVEVNATGPLSAGSGTLEVYYTNEANTTNRVGTGIALDSAATFVPCRVPYSAEMFANMQGNDNGVKKIDKAKFTATTFTSINMLCISVVHPIWSVSITKGVDPDMVAQAIHGLNLQDNACLMMLFRAYTTAAPALTGRVHSTEN